MCKVKGSLLLIGLCSLAVVSAQDNSNQVRQGKLGIFNGLGGTTNLLTTLAQDLLSRSTTSSQVLSLNLTNLVILLVLKAIIFGASSFGFGHGAHGRSMDGLLQENLAKQVQSKALVSETELLLMLSYLKADSTQKYGCLHRVACEDPYKAKEYLFAGKMVLKGSELFSQ